MAVGSTLSKPEATRKHLLGHAWFDTIMKNLGEVLSSNMR